MYTLCACREYTIDTEQATYVRNGIPMCHEETCKKVKARHALNPTWGAELDNETLDRGGDNDG